MSPTPKDKRDQAAEAKRTAGRPDADKRRETGTAGHDPDDVRPAEGLPPDPSTLGRPLTDDEKVDEALLESMDASDPPAHSAPSPGAPDHGAPDKDAPDRRRAQGDDPKKRRPKPG